MAEGRRDAAKERIVRKVEGRGKKVEVYRVQWGRENVLRREKIDEIR